MVAMVPHLLPIHISLDVHVHTLWLAMYIHRSPLFVYLPVTVMDSTLEFENDSLYV